MGLCTITNAYGHWWKDIEYFSCQHTVSVSGERSWRSLNYGNYSHISRICHIQTVTPYPRFIYIKTPNKQTTEIKKHDPNRIFPKVSTCTTLDRIGGCHSPNLRTFSKAAQTSSPCPNMTSLIGLFQQCRHYLSLIAMSFIASFFFPNNVVTIFLL